MKRLIIVTLIMITAGGSLTGAQTQVDVDRKMLWLDFLFYGRLAEDYNAGIFTILRTRYSLSYEKEKNNTTVDNTSQGAYLQEMMIGPYYNYKNGAFSYFIAPTYRPMLFFVDEKKDSDPESYLHHTIHWFNILKYRIAQPVSLMYRIIAWHRFPVSYRQNGSQVELDANSYTRHFFNIIYHINKRWSFSIGDEIFLNHTASDKGEQTYWRNGLWTGFSYRPAKKHQFDVQYVRFQTYKSETDTQKVTVLDHYLRLVYRLRLNLASGKKLPAGNTPTVEPGNETVPVNRDTAEETVPE